MLVKIQKEDKMTYEKREKNEGRYRKGGEKDDRYEYNGKERAKEE